MRPGFALSFTSVHSDSVVLAATRVFWNYLMIRTDVSITAEALLPQIEAAWGLSASKIDLLTRNRSATDGSPVFTVRGQYTSKGWTEWTQGFEFGSALLQFDATDERRFLDFGRSKTRAVMASHITHMGVHDHGFNNISTYGNLRRLILEGRFASDPAELEFCELALKCSGAVQARRWTPTAEGGGFIYSFNGPHSLFADTMRSLRSLSLAHRLGHALLEEQDARVSLLSRMVAHAETTARYAVFYGEGRDAYDVRGRVAHESIFNINNGVYRCPNSQQGYSAFSTWTRGLAWVMLGFAEELEFLETVPDGELEPLGGRTRVEAMMRRAAEATCDFYCQNSPTDGIPYWDTGAPGLAALGYYLDRPADPFNDYEPVDSSAAAIAVQGLLRLGKWLSDHGNSETGARYWQTGLTVLHNLLAKPYLSTDEKHQGLLLHSVYHRPNGWDYVPEGRRVPCGESSMWGDYHLREALLFVQRVALRQPYLTFYTP